MATPPRLRGMETALIAGVLLFALGLAGAAVWAGGRESLAVVQAVPRMIVPVLLVMSMANYAARMLRWLLFSRALGFHVPAVANALYYIAGFAMTTTPGKVGEALRLWLLRRYHGIVYERSAALLVADRLADALATTVVVAVTVFWFSHYLYAALIAMIVVAAIATVCLRPVLLLWGIDFAFGRVRRWPRLFVRGRRMVRGLGQLAPARVLMPALVLSVIGWSSEGLSLYVLLHALAVPVNPLACVFIFSFSMLVGAISVLPGGLGSTEATMIGLLTTQSVPLATAIIATAVVRVTTLWFAVALGLVALPLALRGGVGLKVQPEPQPHG
jgi:uncharacterized membrane protein YbhN (UPF0104 family)